MFSNWLNLFQKPNVRLTQFGSDLQNWEESTSYNCLIVMTGGKFYLGRRYLDIYQIGWKYYFRGLEGEWTSYQFPSQGYQMKLSNDDDSRMCLFEKYTGICPGEKNKMVVPKYLDLKEKEEGPLIFVKTNGSWTQEEVEKILL